MKQTNTVSARSDKEHLHHPLEVLIDQRKRESSVNSRRKEKAALSASLLDMWMQRYNPTLSAYALHLLGTDDIAQDIVQDTWMALYIYIQQQPPSWVNHANVPAWLRTVARNKALNYKKKQTRISSLNAAPFVGELHMPTFDYPENAAIREDTNRVLYQAIKTLRKPLREVIAYRFFYGLGLHEIAQKLDVPLNTVKDRLTRGKKQLQKLLTEGGIECDDLDAWTLGCS